MKHTVTALTLLALVCASVDQAAASMSLCLQKLAAHTVVSPVGGKTYSLDGRGCAVFADADAPWFLAQGFRTWTE